MQRRLAAVLAADVAGYSRLMGADEAGTLADLQALKSEILGPAASGNAGDIVKSMGDGWLIAFYSANDAVNAAMQVQDALAGHARLKLRIGVHIGDVTFAQEDLYGDGVNVSARLESIAPPGGIAISDLVHASIDGTLAPSFDDGGEQALRNIARPLRIWTRPPARSTPTSPAQGTGGSGLPHLTIQPVSTSDPRRDVVELAEALTSDFGTYLAPVAWLRATVSDSEMSGYVLRSTLRARGDRLRLETRLTAADGREVSTRKFDSTVDQSFDWQDEVAEAVASDCLVAILDAETRALDTLAQQDLTAEQCVLAGMMAWRSFAADAFVEALAFYERAIRANPDLSAAYAEAIIVTISGKTMGLSDLLARFDAQMPDWIARAEAFAGQNATLDLSLAIAHYMTDRDAPKLARRLTDLLRRAPFDTRVLSFAGWGYLWCGRTQEALDCHAKSLRAGKLSPFHVAALGGAATACVQLNRPEEALEYTRMGMELSDTYRTLYSSAAAACVLLNRQEEAERWMARCLELSPEESISSWRAYNDYGGSEGGERYFAALRQAGLPE